MNIVVIGANGRMGQSLISSILTSDHYFLVGAVVEVGSALIGSDVGKAFALGERGVNFVANLNDVICNCDVVIDFTSPQATLSNLAICMQYKVPMVIGTTGFDLPQLSKLKQASAQIPIVLAANFSVGINLLLQLVADAAKVLAQSDFDIEVIESHHRNKVDAPSGTALKIGEVLAQSLQRKLDEHAVYERYGQVGVRPKNAIGFSAIRGGDIVGEHTVLFAGLGERLEITHKASDRQTFAQGAIRAASWLQGKKAGLYDMKDVIKAC